MAGRQVRPGSPTAGLRQFDPKFTVKTIKFPKKQMVWGCFSWAGRGKLAFLDMAHAKITRFLQDGAPCHQAKAVKECLALKNMAVMNWPGNSPDLNPIENLWSWMKKQLANRPTPSSLAILRQEIFKLWCERTSVTYCRALVKSMSKRCSHISVIFKARNMKF